MFILRIWINPLKVIIGKTWRIVLWLWIGW